MRRLFSLLFAILLLLNSLGYYGLFIGLRYQQNVEMMQKLDQAAYREADLITIKIPISIPYATDSEDFERVNGIFEHKGEFFRLVKQRFRYDTLHIVCFKDQELGYINQAWEKYVKTFADSQSDNKPNGKTTHTFIKDYLVRTFSILASSLGWECEVLLQSSIPFLIPDFHPSIIHPPERLLA